MPFVEIGNKPFTMFLYPDEMKKWLKLSTTLILASTLSGCALATAGIKKGDERSFSGSLRDINAGRAIEARMRRAHDFELSGIDVEVAEKVVVLSGNVPTQEDKIEATRIAWSAPGVEQVGNEILIKGKQTFLRNTKDGVLEKAVRTRLTVDKYVKARNFNVETHDGIVYLLGVARTDEELKRAAEIAATTKGAREVISYVKLADLPDQTPQHSSVPQAQIVSPQFSAPQISAPQQRALPDFLTTSPSQVQQAPAPIQSLPLSEPIPFELPSETIQAFPSTPQNIDLGDRVGKEFPTDEQLGTFRTGQAGEAVSIIESDPYYIDPDTGEHIPVRFDSNGNLVPKVIR